ncbi:MAG: cation-translocating P-type ATPase [Proteobacteria bacterium]|nr:cation-translocating P-type ATPase [Pseudomonadota bacterium]
MTIDITGMTCAACSARVETVLSRQPGVIEARVSLPLERADVSVSDAEAAAGLVKAIEDAGYHARLRGESSADRRAAREAKAKEHAALRSRTQGLAALATLLALPFLIDMTRMMITGEHTPAIPPLMQAVLATIVQIVCGARFYRGAFAALRSGFANMDVLVAVGTSAAYGVSLYNLLSDRVHHGGGLYFEASVTVITFLLIGKVLEGKARSGAGAALEALAHAVPQTATRIVGGLEANVDVASLKAGYIVLVRPGAQVPADGTITEGVAAFNEALITGESLPISRGPGDRVVAGSVATGGSVHVSVTATGDDTRLQRIARLIEDADIARSPVQQLADRISAVFVPAVLVIALLAGIGWYLARGDGEVAMLVAVAVLVVACPCALGLATPIALVAGANAAAKAGLIVTDHSALEAAGRVTRIAFDKTGTLTRGLPAVAAIAASDRRQVLGLAAALASRSDHPLDRALVQQASEDGLALPAVADFTAISGGGLSGRIEKQVYRLGNGSFLRAQGVEATQLDALISGEDFRKAGSIAYLARDREVLGAFGFADEPRPQVGETLAGLEKLGVAVTVLSGDRTEAVQAFARQFGLQDARAGLTPEEKIRSVHDMMEAGAVLGVVGDGINDAPALRAADLGMAMGTGTDAAKAAASVTLARPDPRLVPAMVRAGRATRATIAQNLAFAFLFNGIGIPLAAMGKLTPALAGAAMALSSVSVVLNAWRLARRDFAPGNDHSERQG